MRSCFLIPFICISLSVLSCSYKNSQNVKSSVTDSAYTFSGKIKGVDSGWVYIAHRQSEMRNTDSVMIKNGTFFFSGKAVAPEFCNLGISGNGKKEFYFGFFLQSGTLALTGNKDSLNDSAVIISGSPVQDEFKLFQKMAKPIDSTDYQLQLAYATANAAYDKSKIDSINNLFRGSEKKRQKLIKDYAAEHPSSYVAVFEVYSYFSEKWDLLQLKSMYNSMTPEIRESYFGKKIKEKTGSGKKY